MIPLTPYVHGPDHDLLVASWWARMRHDGDLVRLVGRDCALSDLFETFDEGEMFFATDEGGIWFAAWLNPFLGSAWASVYVAPAWRKSAEAAEAYQQVLAAGLAAYSQLFSVTAQPRILPPMYALGYELLVAVPDLFYGATAYVCRLTREGFAARAFATRPDDPTVAAYRPRDARADAPCLPH